MDSSEASHILVSVFMLSLAFSVNALYAGLPSFIASFPIVLLTLGVGFVAHELSHRAVAKRFGCFAFYRAWVPGLMLALGLAVMTGGRFLFAAPGAVHIGGRHLTPRQSAMVSLAGPGMNLLVGLVFLMLTTSSTFLVRQVASVGAYINFFLAFFNLIPFPPLDGSKIINWNVGVWGAAIGVAAFFVYFVM
ncbi:MAG: site-2 protease family protein [Candidatus Diapherotrites archaeon]|nr:site-2 protease family protein [Candidatus Diapherotrites archaeon]